MNHHYKLKYVKIWTLELIFNSILQVFSRYASKIGIIALSLFIFCYHFLKKVQAKLNAATTDAEKFYYNLVIKIKITQKSLEMRIRKKKTVL